jgi:hypothetical protein
MQVDGFCRFRRRLGSRFFLDKCFRRFGSVTEKSYPGNFRVVAADSFGCRLEGVPRTFGPTQELPQS